MICTKIKNAQVTNLLNLIFLQGIQISDNSFTNNKGCYSSFGNVVIACEPSSTIGKDYSLSAKAVSNYTKVQI